MTQHSSGGILGMVEVFARHPVAANLLMAIMALTGLFSLTQINRQFFPDFGIDIVTVSVEWPGASAGDIDENIIEAIEPEVRFLDGVDEVDSTSYEGLASISIEFEQGHDMQQALADVEQAVGQVTTLPDDAESPEVRRIIRYETVTRIVLSGNYPERALARIAKTMRDDLLDLGIDKVTIQGLRDEEIWVGLRPEILRELNITIADIAARIRESSQDLPSGDLGDGQRQVRSLGDIETARDVAGLEIRALPNGQKILLGDIADVTERYEEGGQTARRMGTPAFELDIKRSVDSDAIDLANRVNRYLEEFAPTLPASISVEQYDIEADAVRDRINLLLRNGLGGLVLVLLVLYLFLNGRVAFWVAAGIPASLLATVTVMWLSGQTINMISLFGMIMAVGIVVDDAIVVGEHSQALAQRGMGALDAAIAGAQRMVAPVMSATLTTIAAFLPLFIIGGIMGAIIRALPFVVVAVLLASLVECFLVLPGHMREALSKHDAPRGGLIGAFVAPWRPLGRALAAFREGFDERFCAFRDGPFRWAVTLALAWRYTTIATCLGVFIVSIGLLTGGRVPYQFFPTPEPDRIYANIEMIAGTERKATEAMVDELERALHAAAESIAGPGNDLVVMSLGKVGTSVGASGMTSNESPDTLGGLVAELKASDQRDIRTSTLIQAWKEEIEQRPGVERLKVQGARAGPPGRDVDVRLTGTDALRLKKASTELQELVGRYPSVGEVGDDLPYGRPEFVLEVTPRGRALGLTTESVGRQVRDAIEGTIAKRFPRGDEEVTVRVQFERDATHGGLLDDLWLRVPDSGAEVPLKEAVSIREDRTFSRVRREDGQTQLSVTADILDESTSTGKIIAALPGDGLEEIAGRYDVSYSFSGRAEEQRDTQNDMMNGAMLGLIIIYIILAWVFASYTRPFVVMFIIPMALIGAIAGHWLLNYSVTILSLFALLGLSGIVINDSIILVTTIDRRRREQPSRTAIIDGTCDRLRAVILTSATTIGGLLPLLFEKSLQAQFLIPMAITLVFGLAVATMLVLFVVPALLAIQDDLKRLASHLDGTAGRATETSLPS